MNPTLKNSSNTSFWAHSRFKNIFISILVLGVVLIAGCANQESLVQNTKFSSKITETGLKHFEVTLGFLPPPKPRVLEQKSKQPEERGKPPEERGKKYKGRRSDKRIMKVAQIHIEQNGFCRSGFWVMEIDMLRPVPRLRGECNELANDKDRERFPDSIITW